MTDTPSAKYTLQLGWESEDVPRIVLHDPRAGLLPTLQTRIVASRTLTWLKGRMLDGHEPRLETTPGKAIALFPICGKADPGLQECLEAVGLRGWKEVLDSLSPQLPRLLGRPDSVAPRLTVTQDAPHDPIQVHLTGRGLPGRRRSRKAPRHRIWL
jgi:hypothetical protein